MGYEYLNFDIQLHSCGGTKHFVVAKFDIKDPDGKLSGEVVKRREMSVEDLIGGPGDYLRGLVGKPKDAILLGTKLRAFLFPQEVEKLFYKGLQFAEDENKSGVRIRLRIYDDSNELSMVPWEYCWGEKQFMTTDVVTPLVRYPPTDENIKSISVQEKVRILAVMASPEDQEELDLDTEEKWIKAALRPLQDDGYADLRVKKRISQGELYDLIVDDFNPHILHFFGHGELQEDGKGALILEKELQEVKEVHGKKIKWQSNPLRENKLIALMRRSNIRLVVLSACETAAIAKKEPGTRIEDSFMGIGHGLVWAGVPSVLAMQFKVPVRTAKMFMGALYKQLVARIPLDRAVAKARHEVFYKGDDEVYWAIPVLFMRAPDGVIFK